MTNPFGKDAPLLPSLQLIAAALVPVLSAFREELGEDRANAIAARGLAEWRRGLASGAAARVVGEPRDRWEKATADTLATVADTVDVEDLSESDEGIRFQVTGCQVARYFHDIGETELGYELGCAHDIDHTAAVGGGTVELTRDGTLMQGAPHCSFHYRFQPRSTDG